MSEQHTSHHSFPMPTWMPHEEEYRPNYRAQYNVRFSSGVSRGLYAQNVLDRLLLPHIPTPLNIVIVGAGKRSYGVRNTFEMSNIAALLDYRGADYNLTIVDIDQEALDIAQGQRHVYIRADQKDSDKINFALWTYYCQITGQADDQYATGVIRPIPIEGLCWDYTQSKEEYLCARIPKSLEEKIETGAVRFIQGDIALIQPALVDSIDLLTCTYVYYLLPAVAQMRATYQIARCLKPGGFTVISHGERSPFLKSEKGGGWLNEQKMNDLQLRQIQFEVPGNDNKSYTLFQRHI